MFPNRMFVTSRQSGTLQITIVCLFFLLIWQQSSEINMAVLGVSAAAVVYDDVVFLSKDSIIIHCLVSRTK